MLPCPIVKAFDIAKDLDLSVAAGIEPKDGQSPKYISAHHNNTLASSHPANQDQKSTLSNQGHNTPQQSKCVPAVYLHTLRLTGLARYLTLPPESDAGDPIINIPSLYYFYSNNAAAVTCASKPITSIRRRDVQAFIDMKIAEGTNPNYLRLSIIASLSCVFSRYVGEELLARNPASGQPSFIYPKAVGSAAQKKGRAITPAEIEALLNNSPPQFWPIFVCMIHSAMRIGETLAMTWGNLHIENDASGRAIIRYKVAHTLERVTYKLVPVKTEASNAEIYLPASIVPIIEEQRRRIATARLSNANWIDQDLVWPKMPKLGYNTNGFGSPLRPSLVRAVLSRSATRANIGFVRPHDLRHTCASLLISENVNIKIVSGHLRHAKTSTTWDIYGHLYPDDQAQAAHKLGSIFEGPISAKMG